MTFALLFSLGALVVGDRLVAGSTSASLGAASASSKTYPFQRGMALADHVGRHDDPGGVESVRQLRELHCDWIQISPFAFQDDVHRPELRFPNFLETQRAYVDSLRALGFKILLKPDIWSNQFWNGEVWRGDLQMHSDQDWKTWFANYREFMVHYATFAEEEEIEMLCVGLEYVTATRERPEDWKCLIQDLRLVYTGPMTYAAHWPNEADSLSFWGDLDFIGIDLYPDLCETPVTSPDELLVAWAPVTKALESIADRWGKPILLTEIGFSSTACAANDPWRWVDRGAVVSQEEQAVCYESAFRALWGKPWFAGAYWWKWYVEPHAGGEGDPGFTPQGKAASKVLATWYAKPAPPIRLTWASGEGGEGRNRGAGAPRLLRFPKE